MTTLPPPGKTNSGVDQVYKNLTPHFADKFMNMTMNELKSIETKQLEYKALLRKSVFISFVLMNLHTRKIRDVLKVYHHLNLAIRQQKQQFQSYEERIGDFDSIPLDAIRVFVTQLLITLTCKHSSSLPLYRKESW